MLAMFKLELGMPRTLAGCAALGVIVKWLG
jgi:hypothetical protein